MQTVVHPLRNHKNNFDLLRLTGALLVLFSHSYGEALHPAGNGDLVSRWLGPQYPMSIFGLMIFFTISGYLVTQSLLTSVSVKQYIWKRILRLFPAYIVVTLLTVFILGPFFTTVPLRNYFSDPLTRQFLFKNFFLLVNKNTLPGVFNGRNVNLSAWTLPLELKLYGILLLLFLLRFFRNRLLQGIFFLCLLLVKCCFPVPLLQHWFPFFDFSVWFTLGFFFIAGSSLYVWRDKIVLHYAGVIVLAFTWYVTAYLHLRNDVPAAVFFAYTILFTGLKTPVLLRPGIDLSYGIYIYGYPVQETVSWLTGYSLPLWKYNVVVVPVTVLLAFLSWHLVEKKALMFKNKVY